MLDDFNSMHTNLEFTEEIEQNSRLNCLDITVHKTPSKVKIFIYRKPTFTDTFIPYISNHPVQHKYAAIRFLYNRLNSHHLHNGEYQHEETYLVV
jgi:hypothetical protein